MITTPCDLYFHSTRLSLHTLDVTDRLWDSSDIVLMIDDPQSVELKMFQSIEKSFDDIMMKIIIYLTTR